MKKLIQSSGVGEQQQNRETGEGRRRSEEGTNHGCCNLTSGWTMTTLVWTNDNDFILNKRQRLQKGTNGCSLKKGTTTASL